MADTGLAGVAMLVLRGRPAPGPRCAPATACWVVHTMRFADEIRDPSRDHR